MEEVNTNDDSMEAFDHPPESDKGEFSASIGELVPNEIEGRDCIGEPFRESRINGSPLSMSSCSSGRVFC